MNIFDTATPYIASYVILRRGDTVAFILRSHTKWMNGFYSLPSGKVEKRESFSEAAIREAREEAGVDIQLTDLTHAITVHRHDYKTEWVDVYFEVSKWEGEPHNAEPHMHSELAWFDLTNLPDNVIPAVRFTLEHLKAGKTYAEYEDK